MAAYFAIPGEGEYGHLFGGTRWRIVAPEGATPAPTLILLLDLRDPRLGLTRQVGVLPVCARLDGEDLERQYYSFDERNRVVAFEGPPWNVDVDPLDALPNPLPECQLDLRPVVSTEEMREEMPRNLIPDTFAGGAGFLRVGEPDWLTGPEPVECPECGRHCEFAACIGSEAYDEPSGIVSATKAFFVGELATYYFCCFECSRMVVVAQGT